MFLGSTLPNVPLSWRSQISGLIVKETLTKVPNKYADLADVFSLDLVSELPKHIGINNYAIKLVNS